MNSLKQILLEKLILNKTIKNNNIKKDINVVDISWKVKAQFNATTRNDKIKYYQGILKTYNTTKNIKKLFNSNTHLFTIVNKWFCAFLIQWNDAIKVLQDEILKFDNSLPGGEDVLNSLILSIYNGLSKKDLSDLDFLKTYILFIDDKEKLKDCCENYFKLYNLKYT